MVREWLARPSVRRVVDGGTGAVLLGFGVRPGRTGRQGTL
jgi:threonine/homoserine/homoserine lactone efflux protein